MKKTILFLAALFLVALTLQSVSAAYSHYDYNPKYNYGRAVIVLNDNHDSNRYFWDSDWDFRDDDDYWYGWRDNKRWCSGHDDDWLTYKRKANTVRWLVNSFNDRYDLTAGRSTGDAFCQGCKVNPDGYWGNRPAYDFTVHTREPYYKPQYNYNSGTFNWRF